MKDEYQSQPNDTAPSYHIGFTSLFIRIKRSEFIRQVGETFATRVLLIGIGLITTVIVARILGPEGRGLYAVAMAVSSIGVQFGNLGLHASNTYYVAKDRGLLPKLVGNTLMVSFCFGGLGAGLAWLVFLLWPGLAPVHGILLSLALVWIPFGLAYMLLQNILLGIQEVRAYNKIELANKILSVILIGILFFIGAVRVELVFSTGLIVLAFSLSWVIWRLMPYFSEMPRPSLPLFRDNINYAFKAYLASFFAFMVLRSDLLLVKYMLGAEQAGFYSIAVSMADIVYMLPVVTGTILFPKLASMSSNLDKWVFTKTVAFYLGLGMLILICCAIILAKPIIALLFGNEFLRSVSAFIWLMPGIFMLSLTSIFSNYVASIHYPLSIAIVYFFTMIVNFILNIFFIKMFGIVGASFSSSICYFLCFIGMLVITCKTKSKTAIR